LVRFSINADDLNNADDLRKQVVVSERLVTGQNPASAAAWQRLS